MAEPESLSETLQRRLRARPVFLVAGVLALVAAAWLLLRPDPEELEEIVTVDAAGDTVVYSGPVRDAVARARIVEAFNSVVAPVEDSAPPASDAEADSAKRADSAARAARQAAVDSLARLYADPVDPVAVVRALNLAVLGFADGAANLPPDAAGFIQAAAEAIDRTRDGTSFLVAGYARGGEDAAADLALSQLRADAVLEALESAGADADRLRAEGYGGATPGSEEGVSGDVAVPPGRQIVFRLLEPPEPADDAEAVETDEGVDGAEADEAGNPDPGDAGADPGPEDAEDPEDSGIQGNGEAPWDGDAPGDGEVPGDQPEAPSTDDGSD